MECGWIDSTIWQHLSPSNFSLYLWWMVREGWDWCMCSIMVTTTCFWGAGGVKVGFALIHFLHQDCVILDWFRQFTASQPFQCLIVSILNGCTRLIFEFAIHNHHYTLAFESWVMKIRAPQERDLFTPLQQITQKSTLISEESVRLRPRLPS